MALIYPKIWEPHIMVLVALAKKHAWRKRKQKQWSYHILIFYCSSLLPVASIVADAQPLYSSKYIVNINSFIPPSIIAMIEQIQHRKF